VIWAWSCPQPRAWPLRRADRTNPRSVPLPMLPAACCCDQ